MYGAPQVENHWSKVICVAEFCRIVVYLTNSTINSVCLSPALLLHFRMNLQLCKLCYQIINFSQTFDLQPPNYSALKIEEWEHFSNQPNPGFLFCFTDYAFGSTVLWAYRRQSSASWSMFFRSFWWPGKGSAKRSTFSWSISRVGTW